MQLSEFFHSVGTAFEGLIMSCVLMNAQFCRGLSMIIFYWFYVNFSGSNTSMVYE